MPGKGQNEEKKNERKTAVQGTEREFSGGNVQIQMGQLFAKERILSFFSSTCSFTFHVVNLKGPQRIGPQDTLSPVSLATSFPAQGAQSKQQAGLPSWGVFLNPGRQLSLHTAWGI